MTIAKPRVFDTLTHFVGEDGAADLGKPLGIDGYLAYATGLANPNVGAVNLLSGACPKYDRGMTAFVPCKWDVRGGRIQEFAYETINGRTVERPVSDDCYAEANNVLFGEAKVISLRHPEITFFHSPLVHPQRTSVEELERLLGERGKEILGLKVHGIASASGPKDFDPELATYIAKSGVPLIVHTDFYNGPTGSIQTPGDALAHLQKINNPRDWVDFCMEYGMKASLQHGARNDREVFRMIKDNAGQFTVGLGPMIDGMGTRIVRQTDNYVGAVFDHLGPEHVVFSTDYPHNEEGEDLTQDVLALSEDEQEMVFHRNAEEFFGVSVK